MHASTHTLPNRASVSFPQSTWVHLRPHDPPCRPGLAQLQPILIDGFLHSRVALQPAQRRSLPDAPIAEAVPSHVFTTHMSA